MKRILTVMSVICLSLGAFANSEPVNGCSYEAFLAAQETAVSTGFAAARPATRTVVTPVRVEGGGTYTYTFKLFDETGNMDKVRTLFVTAFRSDIGECRIVEDYTQMPRHSRDQ